MTLGVNRKNPARRRIRQAGGKEPDTSLTHFGRGWWRSVWMANKRLTLEEKVKLVQELELGRESVSALCRRWRISPAAAAGPMAAPVQSRAPTRGARPARARSRLPVEPAPLRRHPSRGLRSGRPTAACASWRRDPVAGTAALRGRELRRLLRRIAGGHPRSVARLLLRNVGRRTPRQRPHGPAFRALPTATAMSERRASALPRFLRSDEGAEPKARRVRNGAKIAEPTRSSRRLCNSGPERKCQRCA